MVGGFHVYKSVFLGWVVGRFKIAVNGEHNCGVLPKHNGRLKICVGTTPEVAMPVDVSVSHSAINGVYQCVTGPYNMSLRHSL